MWCVMDLVSAFSDEQQQQRRRQDASKPRSGLAVLAQSLGEASADGQVQKVEPASAKVSPPRSMVGMPFRLRLRKPAAQLGYAASALGILALVSWLLAPEDSLMRLRAGSVALLALAAQSLGAVLLTISVHGHGGCDSSSARWRVGLVVILALTLFAWASIARQDEVFGPVAAAEMTVFQTGQWTLVAPAVAMLLNLAWPLTWLSEAPMALNFWVQWYRLQPA